jgi:hypothetical protein
MTLADVRAEGIDPDAETDDAPEALMLTVRHWGLLVPASSGGRRRLGGSGSATQ